MVYIFYYCSVSRMPVDCFEHYLDQLPAPLQKKVLSFRQWQDAERSLAGNILLLKGLESLKISGYSLSGLKYTTFDKPYFDEQLFFNISHSGSYTVCAISQTNYVGIDVEEIREVPLAEITGFFHNSEWLSVLNSSEPLKAFYTLWTKKESFLKLTGMGLNEPLDKILIENNRVKWGNADWFLQEIPLDTAHICYLCSAMPPPQVTVKEINLLEGS